MSSELSPQEAEQLADLLNQICGVTIGALLDGELQRRLDVAVALREFHAQFGAESSIAPFILLLVRWLEGRRPTLGDARALDTPFRNALRAMLKQVPEQVGRSPNDEPKEPISRHVLAQLISAVVAAILAGDSGVQQTLAAQLINIQMKLDRPWRDRLGPLLENLRAVLGGADPRTLPQVGDEGYQKLWSSAVELLLSAELNEETARSRLLERLVHNTLFVYNADSKDLTPAYLRSLLDVQRQALESGATGIATLVAAIRALLQGMEPDAFASLLEGAELDAWLEILAGTTEKEIKR